VVFGIGKGLLILIDKPFLFGIMRNPLAAGIAVCSAGNHLLGAYTAMRVVGKILAKSLTRFIQNFTSRAALLRFDRLIFMHSRECQSTQQSRQDEKLSDQI
jgi:hypothetical protein